MAGPGALHLIVALSSTLAAPAPPRPTPSESGGPASAIHALARAYESRSVEGMAGLFTADYRFHFSAKERTDLEAWFDGFTREHELQSASGLFNGVVRDGQIVMPGAESITATLDGLEESPDPEHPDSTAHYRIVAVHRFRLAIVLAGPGRWAGPSERDTIALNPSLHVFHLVRGDAAVRADGQPADAGRWYMRRWLEDVDGLTLGLAANRGECGEPAPRPGAPGRSEGAVAATAGAPGAPVHLAIHPLGNPACPTIELTCDLPGSEPALLEVFDVTGRRMNQRDVPVARPGTVKVEGGAGARIVPGVYWVRLSQGSRRPTTKMVVVAR